LCGPGTGNAGNWFSTRAAGAVRVVNAVPVEQYLRGVVPSEMPGGWRPAALEAQAIASRSFAVHAIRPTAAFDLNADTRSQAYGGVAAETKGSDAAIRSTAGETLTYGGRVIDAVFAASDGGYTDDVENVWGGARVTYLVRVLDPLDGLSPMHLWSRAPSFTGARLGRLLGAGGTATAIDVVARGVSPRVVSARVVLASGARRVMAGTAIQMDLGLPSTCFSVGRTHAPVPPQPVSAGAGTSVAQAVSPNVVPGGGPGMSVAAPPPA